MKNTTRVQLELPSQAMLRLQHLKDSTEASSYSEVIRNALKLYDDALRLQNKGGHFTVI